MAIKGLERLALFAGRKYRLVFIGCAILLVLAAGSALRLKFDTDVLGLLPQHDPAVETLRETLDDFGSLDFLLIVLRIPDGAAVDPYESFVDVMGPRLSELEHFDQVDYKIGEIEELLESYLPRSRLFVDQEALDAVARRTTDEGLEDRDSLPMADQRRFTSLMAIAFQGNHQQYQFDRDGIGSPETWEYRERSMRWLFQYPCMQQCWREQNDSSRWIFANTSID